MLDSKVLVLTFSPSQMVYSQGAFHTKAGFHLLGCQLFPTKTTAPGYHMPTASMRVFLKFSCKSGTGVPWLCVVIWLGRVCVLDSMLQLPKIQQVSSTPGPRSLASLSLWWGHLDLMTPTFSDAVVMAVDTQCCWCWIRKLKSNTDMPCSPWMMMGMMEVSVEDVIPRECTSTLQF